MQLSEIAFTPRSESDIYLGITFGYNYWLLLSITVIHHLPATYAAREASRGTRKVTRKAPRGTRSEVACKVRASPRKVTCILARRRANGSMRDCVEVSRVSRAASDAAWNRSCRAERRWGSNMRFHRGAGLPAGEAQAGEGACVEEARGGTSAGGSMGAMAPPAACGGGDESRGDVSLGLR